MSTSSLKIHVGMDVHKDTVMVAVLPESAEKPTIVKQLPNDERALRRFLARVAKDGELQCCYEASGAGYILQRAIERWGHACEVIAPALILTRPATTANMTASMPSSSPGSTGPDCWSRFASPVRPRNGSATSCAAGRPFSARS